jgi:glycerol-3-phosphate acyltransferase PlsY
MLEALTIAAGYLIGSIDVAVWVARREGIDIYSAGSGNPGASNVLRVLGRSMAAIVFAADLLKGLTAAALGEIVGGSELVGFAAGAAAVLGHCYPVWHRFHGGKGVATTVGMTLWLIPGLGVAMAAIWVAILTVTRVASYGSLLIVLVAVPVTAIWARERWSVMVMAAVALLVFWRHSGNIKRMIAGGERTV